MAESIDVVFADATLEQLRSWLDQHAIGCEGKNWSYPTAEYLVLAYEWPDFFAELAPTEMDELKTRLGCAPSCGFQLEIRRSKGDEAIRAAMAFSSLMLSSFKGAAYGLDGELMSGDHA